MFVSMCIFLSKSNAFTKFSKGCTRGKGFNYDSKNAILPFPLIDTKVFVSPSLRDDKYPSFSKGTKLLKQLNISYPGF